MIKEEDVKDMLINMWPSFIKWWSMPAGGQTAMNYWENKSDITVFVKEFEPEES